MSLGLSRSKCNWWPGGGGSALNLRLGLRMMERVSSGQHTESVSVNPCDLGEFNETFRRHLPNSIF